jgi:hypothetical protein
MIIDTGAKEDIINGLADFIEVAFECFNIPITEKDAKAYAHDMWVKLAEVANLEIGTE